MRSHSDDDPELRELLDAIGLTAEFSVPTELTEAEQRRAQAMLSRIMSEPRDARVEPARRSHSFSRGWTAWPRLAQVAVAVLVCALATTLVVMQPWGTSTAAAAQTPAMLHFESVRAGEIKPVGDPAGEVLRKLAGHARELSPPGLLPVQRVVLDGWWASTAPPTAEEDARSALIPVRSVAYVLPNGDRRSIERRGGPLDADGRPVQTEADWNVVPPVDDTIASLDPSRGPDYPDTLPLSTPELIEELAPEEACAHTRGGCLLGSVAGIFERYVVAPEVTARIWNALADEPSITTLGSSIDRHGRAAVVLSAQSIDPREQVLVLVDPNAGAYLGSETILIAPNESYGFEPPAVISFTSLVSVERVAESDVPDDSTATRY